MDAIQSLFDEIISRFRFHSFREAQQEPPSEDLVKVLERTTGYSLPKEYRAFLLKYGGLSSSVNVEVPLGESGLCSAVGFFKGFYRDEPNPNLKSVDITHGYVAMRGLSRIKDSTLPFLLSEGGDVFCIQLAGEQTGSIHLWVFEMFEGMDEHDFIYVAPDFLSFLRSFRESSV